MLPLAFCGEPPRLWGASVCFDLKADSIEWTTVPLVLRGYVFLICQRTALPSPLHRLLHSGTAIANKFWKPLAALTTQLHVVWMHAPEVFVVASVSSSSLGFCSTHVICLTCFGVCCEICLSADCEGRSSLVNMHAQ
jgi:hypothetical protein